jgi:hypothetical protein
MHSYKQTKLFDTIFKLFPGASIISKSELRPNQQIESAANGNSELAKRAKPQGTVLLACKRKGFDSRQLSLFDKNKRGGI